MEGHWKADAPADFAILGYIDEDSGKTKGIKIEGLTSWLIDFNPDLPVKGLDSIPVEERPPLQITFQSYHIMISVGVTLILISLLGCFLWWQGKLFNTKIYIVDICIFRIPPGDRKYCRMDHCRSRAAAVDSLLAYENC